MAQVAVLIPAMRAHRLTPVVESILASTDDPHVVVIATGECAEVARTLPVTLIDDGGGTWAARINKGIRQTTEPYIMTGADDLSFRPGWFESAMIAMNQLPECSGVVAVNDCYNMAGTHFVAARSYINNFGVIDDPGKLACEAYTHAYVDDEIRSTAKSRGRWGFAHESVVEHLHAGTGKAPHDAVYQMGADSMSQGHQVFMSRKHLWESV